MYLTWVSFFIGVRSTHSIPNSAREAAPGWLVLHGLGAPEGWSCIWALVHQSGLIESLATKIWCPLQLGAQADSFKDSDVVTPCCRCNIRWVTHRTCCARCNSGWKQYGETLQDALGSYKPKSQWRIVISCCLKIKRFAFQRTHILIIWYRYNPTTQINKCATF